MVKGVLRDSGFASARSIAASPPKASSSLPCAVACGGSVEPGLTPISKADLPAMVAITRMPSGSGCDSATA